MAVQDFRIWFWHRTRLVKIENTALNETLAVLDAKLTFMERFGYWPGDPHQVDRFTQGMT